MARIRTVKPSLFSSPSMARVDIPARYLFIGLFTEADDEGRMYDSPKKIAGNLFPHDEHITASKVAGWLDQLVAEDCVARYAVDGIRYLQLNFAEHQKISHPVPSLLPNPSEQSPEDFRNGSGDPPEPFAPEVEVEVEVEVEEELTPSLQAPPETNGKGKDGKPFHLADVVNLNLVVTLKDRYRRRTAWNGVTEGLLTGLVLGSEKKHIPAFGARAVNAAVDDLYANAANVPNPAGYLRERSEAHAADLSPTSTQRP